MLTVPRGMQETKPRSTEPPRLTATRPRFVNPVSDNTIDWKAGCERPARPVWRKGGPQISAASLPRSGLTSARRAACSTLRPDGRRRPRGPGSSNATRTRSRAQRLHRELRVAHVVGDLDRLHLDRLAIHVGAAVRGRGDPPITLDRVAVRASARWRSTGCVNATRKPPGVARTSAIPGGNSPVGPQPNDRAGVASGAPTAVAEVAHVESPSGETAQTTGPSKVSSPAAGSTENGYAAP